MKTDREIIAKAVELSAELRPTDMQAGSIEDIARRARKAGFLEALVWVTEREAERVSA